MDGVRTLVDLLPYMRNHFFRNDLLNYRYKGGWVQLSADTFVESVELCTFGLYSIGVRRSDMVGLLSNSSPFWIMADLAILSLGAVTVPIFRRISPENLLFEIENSSLNVLFLGDRDELSSVLKSGKRLSTIITIGFSDPSAAMSLDELMALGRQFRDSHQNSEGIVFHSIDPDDLATVIYTSGSTGVPKGVMLTHSNIISQIEATSLRFDIKEDDIALTSLPFAHIFERMVIYFYLSLGIPVYFVDDLSLIGTYMREVRPTVMTVVPRLLEKVYEKMRKGAESSHGLKRALAVAAIKRAETIDPENQTVIDYFYRTLIYSKFNKAMGGRIRYIISGAAALPKDLGRFFTNIGIPLYEGYGMTEASPVIAANYSGNRRIGTVGKIFPGVTVTIADDGEILAKGPNIMKGYYKNNDETEKALEPDGFLHTGDFGKFDSDGFLTISGRKKELFKKSTGEYVPPVPIEQAIAKLDAVDMAAVIANNRKYVTCLIFPDFETVKEKMAKQNFQGTAEDFIRTDSFIQYIQDHISNVNNHIHHTEEVQKFRIVSERISSDTGELTPTMKLRRHIIEEKFGSLIDEMYREEQ
jgi:long-chain acyl-CoA synthetase